MSENSSHHASIPGSSIAWIEDDDALRDEGILYGLSGLQDPTHKIESIRAYYAEKIAACARERPSLQERQNATQERLSTLAGQIREMEDRLLTQDGGTEATREKIALAPPLVRYGVGMALAASMFLANWVLIDGLLSTRPAHALVTLAIMLAGMFILFSPISAIYQSEASQRDREDAPEPWKVWVTEVVPPSAAALFAVVWSDKQVTIVESTATFVFIAALFFFGGKLILSLLPRLTDAVRVRRLAAEDDRRRAALRAEYGGLLGTRDSLHRELLQTQDRLRGLPSPDELQQVCERKTELFHSEYHLAVAARDRLGVIA